MNKCPYCGRSDGEHDELNWGDEFIIFMCKAIFWIIIGFGILIFAIVKGITQ